MHTPNLLTQWPFCNIVYYLLYQYFAEGGKLDINTRSIPTRLHVFLGVLMTMPWSDSLQMLFFQMMKVVGIATYLHTFLHLLVDSILHSKWLHYGIPDVNGEQLV